MKDMKHLKSIIDNVIKSIESQSELISEVIGGDYNTVQSLIDKGVDININVKDEDGWTPIMWAANCGHTDIVNLLIENGADINATNDDGCTALMEAADENHIKTVQLLVDKGVDINAKANDGRAGTLKCGKMPFNLLYF